MICVISYGHSSNCTTVLENMYTIQYKEECGRKYDKVCYGPHNSDCKAVVDPGCYQVPTLSPVQVNPRIPNIRIRDFRIGRGKGEFFFKSPYLVWFVSLVMFNNEKGAAF